ncbi:GTP-binding protein [Erysipelothrix rhusiopathiae]|nr:GTP-binding protein [Erysipelothrix rhusiopathiae]MDE8124105.1 GTP-binding protein [Erysipelothrix rhusiopathiae]MDE8144861.1 GTP-binding protein [Erysipelothrix rhusiopathiae]MDE9421337.1 GTP-binding protein [Erysipelothrix rhusiopathiae]
MIPITIITGFLGSGKTTFINQILREFQEDTIGLIINEIGSVNLDKAFIKYDQDRIFEINSACLCCVDDREFERAILDLKMQFELQEMQLKSIIIETSGLAEVNPLIQTILKSQPIQKQFFLNEIITLVDAINGEQTLENYRESLEQIAFADRIYITKATSTPYSLLGKLKAINPLAPVSLLKQDQTYLHLLSEDRFDASHTKYASLSQSVLDQAKETKHHRHSHVDTLTLYAENPLSFSDFKDWLVELVELMGHDLLRYKGILSVEGLEASIVVQGVGSTFMIDYGDEIDDFRSHFVVIGRNINVDKIQTSFKALERHKE